MQASAQEPPQDDLPCSPFGTTAGLSSGSKRVRQGPAAESAGKRSRLSEAPAGDAVLPQPVTPIASTHVFTSTTAAFVPSEASVGIREYLLDAPGFGGRIKAIHSDFNVNEIALNGQIVHLSDESRTLYTQPCNGVVAAPESKAVYHGACNIDKLEAIKKLVGGSQCFLDFLAVLVDRSVITEEEARSSGWLGATCDAALSVHFPAPASKDDRRLLHHTLRELHRSLDSQMQDSAEGSGKEVKVTFRQGVDTRRRWPESRPDFLHFVLWKRNFDTASAINAIARKSGISDRSFGYAGIKDKHAITEQLVSVYRTEPSTVLSAVSTITGLKAGNFSFADRKLRLGDLLGNQFHLGIRDLRSQEAHSATEAASKAMEGWVAGGCRFINYFGLQRFGRGEIHTHDIGKAILRLDYNLAVHLLLKPRQGEKAELRSLREQLMSSKNCAAALRDMPPYWHVEHAVVSELHARGGIDAPGAAQCAVGAIAPRQRNLYMHAYQSFLWNRLCSERIARFGSVPVEGDLVCGASDNVDSIDEEEETEASALPKVFSLTAADVASGKYAIQDIVMPVPGYAVAYPQHAIGWKFVHYLLFEDGFDLPDPSNEAGALEAVAKLWRPRDLRFQLSGAYRKVVEVAKDVSWRLRPYATANDDLGLPHSVGIEDPSESGPLTALLLKVSLPRSAYATMAMREVMKTDTAELDD